MPGFLRLWLCIFLLCIPAHTAVFSQTMLPRKQLQVIHTEYFDVIFPEQSRGSGEYIASIADAKLEEFSRLLGITWTKKIPVSISPFSEEYNGFMSYFPYPHIILYDTPPDVDSVTYRNSLEGLFVHELVHVLSLNSRSVLMRFFHRVFGGWVMPTLLNAPLFMVEGVAVSYESLDGFGRANDPLVHDRLAQAYHEDAFLTPTQVSGVYDYPPFSRAYYEYGGLFSAWLQKKYGMELYAELWEALGKWSGISWRVGRTKLVKAFEKVYPISFGDAWQAFSDSFRMENIRDNSGNLLFDRDMQLLAVTAGPSRVFAVDRYTRDILSVDPETGTVDSVIKTDSTSNYLSASPDGTRMLVSGVRKMGELSLAIVREYDIGSGKQTGRVWHEISRAAYFRNGVVALASEGHANTIVYCPSPGEKVLLLGGNPERLFSPPVPVDGNRIAFIVSEQGKRSLGLYHFDTGEVFFFSAGEDRDAVFWQYIRGLSSSSGNILFSWHDVTGLYRLARISFAESGDPVLTVHETDYSGGVLSPVQVGSQIVYHGRFSTTDSLLSYPGGSPDNSVRTVPLTMIQRDFPRTVPALDAGKGLEYVEKPYVPLRYLNPLRFWFPFPVYSLNANRIRVDGIGVGVYLSTPTDMNRFIVFGGYNFREKIVDIEAEWDSFLFRVPMEVTFRDTINFLTDDSFDFPYRETRTEASFIFTRGLGSERIQFSVSPSFQTLWVAYPHEGAGTAYAWEYQKAEYIPGFMIGLSNWDRLPWELFGHGSDVTAYGHVTLPDHKYRGDAVFRFSTGSFLPVRMTVYGVYDQTGVTLSGSSVSFGQAPWYSAAAVEYTEERTGMYRWLAGGELEVNLISADIQKGFSSLYLNRFFTILGWRAIIFDTASLDDDEPVYGFPVSYDVRAANSLVLKTGMVISILTVPMVPIRVAPHSWIAWRFADGNALNLDESIVFGFGFKVEW